MLKRLNAKGSVTIRSILILSSLLISSCVVITPRKVVDNDTPSDCELVSSELKLGKKKGIPLCATEECLVAGLLITPISLIVSGGIVLVNNSYHYIEEALTCDENGKVEGT